MWGGRQIDQTLFPCLLVPNLCPKASKPNLGPIEKVPAGGGG